MAATQLRLDPVADVPCIAVTQVKQTACCMASAPGFYGESSTSPTQPKADGAGELLWGERGVVVYQNLRSRVAYPDLQRGGHQHLRGLHGVGRPHCLRRVRIHGARRSERSFSALASTTVLSVSFQYSNSFAYPLAIANVACE
uniref:Uncharacterized protein n=1 Tax=Leersia perrieri TaxID=77586 RepID=A0A0D9X252_9ORYZ